ncbi:hypothetical protein KFK09_017776 [Dendrobium nobile]|uniref:Uncharacterized protein n=1 Tax=Dendrobium nobile TaxID=94219 RepID=A0A8T3ATW0_DENNO|nr:hypothetical protein KFK09_017776 [Dendrobium nobile]
MFSSVSFSVAHCEDCGNIQHTVITNTSLRICLNFRDSPTCRTLLPQVFYSCLQFRFPGFIEHTAKGYMPPEILNSSPSLSRDTKEEIILEDVTIFNRMAKYSMSGLSNDIMSLMTTFKSAPYSRDLSLYSSTKKLEERALKGKEERVELEREKVLVGFKGVWRGFHTVAMASLYLNAIIFKIFLEEIFGKKKIYVTLKNQATPLHRER